MGFEALMEEIRRAFLSHTDINTLWSLTSGGREILEQLEKAEKELEAEG